MIILELYSVQSRVFLIVVFQMIIMHITGYVFFYAVTTVRTQILGFVMRMKNRYCVSMWFFIHCRQSLVNAIYFVTINKWVVDYYYL